MGIRAENVAKSYVVDGRTLPVLHEINIDVAPGEFVSIIGPSGSGKTTLFNLLAGVEKPDCGQILIADRPNRLGDTAYMLQKDLLFPWRTIIDNAILGMEVHGVKRREARDKARAVIDRFGLAGFESYYPRQLSGGMRQRVALMRTVLSDKEIMLLDEPFGALDSFTRQRMHGLLQEIWAEFERTILFITHDIDEAVLLSDRVLVLSATRPTTITSTVEVHLPRPRERDAVVEPEFVEAKRKLLELVHE